MILVWGWLQPGVYPFPNLGTTWARVAPGQRRRRLLERLVGHLAALLFSIVFSMPFFIDF